MSEGEGGGQTLIVMGSARPDGDTAAVAKRLAGHCSGPIQMIDLGALTLNPFRYRSPQDDDFLSVVRALTEADRIVWATPMYWYAMSGLLKTFFDRLTDLLLDPEKRPLARALAGRQMWALVIGTDPKPPVGFAEPFRLTAAYFDATWAGLLYVQSQNGGGISEGELSRLPDLAAAIDAGLALEALR